MKKIFSLILAVILLGTLPGCYNLDKEEKEKVTINLGGLKGPTSMGMVKLLSNSEDEKSINNYEFNMFSSPDEILPKILNEELDIAAVPANLSSVIYNKTNGGVKLLSINMLGAIYVVEKNGNSVNSISDLVGKTIYSTGLGSTPEYVLSYILSKNGLDINKDVKMEWKSEHSEVVTALNIEDSGIGILPEPFLSVASSTIENLNTALDLNEEWNKLGEEGSFITGVIIVNSKFYDNNKEAVKNFLKEYSLSTEYVNNNIEESSKLVEKYDIIKEAVAKKALPNCNIVCISGKKMKEDIEGYLNILYDENPQSVGGKLPDEDFYIDYE